MSECHDVLLTGASGVVGRAVLDRMSGDQRFRVRCLTHAEPVDADQFRGDLREERLGLARDEYRDLAGRTDVVVHCAAITDFAAGAGETAELNVAGTARMVEFAQRAGARFVYVSSAFVGRRHLPRVRWIAESDYAVTPYAYLESKVRAEELVRESGLEVVIARPSVVLGDSRDGRIARFQAVHGVMKAVMRGQLPVIPLAPDAGIDFLPSDVVAEALTALVAAEGSQLCGRDYWLTAGSAAMSIERFVGLALDVAAERGASPAGPRLVAPETFDRLFRPLLAEPLSEQGRRKLDELAAVTAVFCDAQPFPTSLGTIPGGPDTPDRAGTRSAFVASLRHLADVQGAGAGSPSASSSTRSGPPAAVAPVEGAA